MDLSWAQTVKIPVPSVHVPRASTVEEVNHQVDKMICFVGVTQPLSPAT